MIYKIHPIILSRAKYHERSSARQEIIRNAAHWHLGTLAPWQIIRHHAQLRTSHLATPPRSSRSHDHHPSLPHQCDRSSSPDVEDPLPPALIRSRTRPTYYSTHTRARYDPPPYDRMILPTGPNPLPPYIITLPRPPPHADYRGRDWVGFVRFLRCLFSLCIILYRTQCDTTCLSTNVSCESKMWKGPYGRWTKWNFTRDARSALAARPGTLPLPPCPMPISITERKKGKER